MLIFSDLFISKNWNCSYTLKLIGDTRSRKINLFFGIANIVVDLSSMLKIYNLNEMIKYNTNKRWKIQPILNESKIHLNSTRICHHNMVMKNTVIWSNTQHFPHYKCNDCYFHNHEVCYLIHYF